MKVCRWARSPQASSPALPVDQEDMASEASQALPKVQVSMFGQSQPCPLGDGQSAFDLDVEGQKTYAREEWLPGVEDQRWACEMAAKFLTTACQFPQESPEEMESDDMFISTKPKPPFPLPGLSGMPGRRHAVLTP